MSKHAKRGAVFVDDSGRRAAVATVGIRMLIAVLTVGLGAVLVSLFTGVPLRGLTSPVALPSAEHARPATTHARKPGETTTGSAGLPRPMPPTSSISAVVPVAAALGRAAGESTGAPAAPARPAATSSPSSRPAGAPSSPATTPPLPVSSAPAPSASSSHGSPSRTAPPGRSSKTHAPHTTPPARG